MIDRMAAKKRTELRSRVPEAIGPNSAALHEDSKALVWISLAVLYLVGAFLAAWTWRKWPDVFVDFGRELYVAWRISEGARLYTDIASFNGPLSSYLNGALFKLFGVSFTTLIVANLLLLGVLVATLFFLFRAWAGTLAALTACLTFLLVFAFAQYVPAGNYNFVSPYAHELTHGLILGVLSIFCLDRWARNANIWWLLACAICVGLTFLTKTENFASALVATAGGLGLALMSSRGSRPLLLSVVAYLAGLAIPVVLSVGLLGLRSTLTPWTSLIGSRLAEDPFYLKGMGLDFPRENLLLLLRWSVALGFLIGAALLIGTRARNPGRGGAAALTFGFAALTGFVLSITGETVSQGGARVLPLTSILLVAWFTWKSLRSRNASLETVPYPVMAAFALYSFCLLAKMILFSRTWHYGFALGVPATLLLVLTLIGLPVRNHAGSAATLRGVGIGFALLLSIGSIHRSYMWYSQKSMNLGRDGDRIRTFHGYQGDGAQHLLDQIADEVDGDATLVAIPEGAMLNYLSRRRSPLKYTNFMPSEMAFFGEDSILADLERNRPDFIATVPHDFSEWGRSHFGEPGYGEGMSRWIHLNYVPVAGRPMEVANQFQEAGFWLLRRAGTMSPAN
jgi:Dolichyl-phosphate-mannose-protein mannosyltransferase